MMMDENISNLTSASGEISASTGSRIETATLYSQQSFASTNQAPPPPKKKRSLPGNPDPDAEVIALSPKSLLATNRFICEICNKGFQRDQNLQLHKRGHNLPWKLKQRANKDVIRKKVYVCPETTCVHHDPSRALGDLTGIKKHFCRKHGEKKWKCEKCSKRYAVQSDWKAHSKICGTREYRCDCGTLFSRRDSFITHRAFCDALAEESARAITLNPLISSHQQLPFSSSSVKIMKREQDNNIVPPWLACPPPSIEDPTPPSPQINLSSQLFPINNLDQQFIQHDHQSPSPNPNLTLPPFQLPTASPHMSATALLQKAAQMGVTISSYKPSPSVSAMVRPYKAHMSETTNGFSSTSIATCTAGSRLGLSSREDMGDRLMTSFGNKAAVPSAIILEQMGTAAREGEGRGGGPSSSSPSPSPTLVHDMVTCLSSGSGFDDEDFNGMFNPKKQEANNNNFFQPNHSKSTTESQDRVRSGNNDGLTRDFLGLKAFSHKDFLNIAGLGHINSSSSSSSSTYGQQQNQNQTPWQG